MKYPWGNLLVIRQYANTNRNSTFAQLKWAIKQFGVEDLFEYNETLPRITYKPTGQMIIFGGLDKELKLTSVVVAQGVLSWVWFEEAFEIPNFDKVMTIAESIRSTVDDPEFFHQAVITFNPWRGGWLKEQFWDNPIADSHAYTTTYRVNEFLPDDVKKRMESIRDRDPRRARITLDGEFGIADGLVFDGHFESRPILGSELTGLQKIVGQDFGQVNDPSTIIQGWVDVPNKKVYLTQEYYKVGATRQEIHNAQVKLGVINDEIFADRQEARLIQELRDMGAAKMMGASKGKGSVAQGVALMREFDFIIDPRLTNTFEEFNTYAFKTDTDGTTLNQPEDMNNHIMDALRYGMQRVLYGTERPKQDKASQLARLKGLGL
jgi:phage terminase large subunit